VRIGLVLPLIPLLAACNGGHSRDAVRQGVIDHLTKVGMNIAGMNVNVTAVQMNGNQAEATVSFTPKGGSASQGMSMKYHLEQRGSNWVVTGRQDASASPHGGAVMPRAASGEAAGAANPHAGGSRMPSPEDLPPAGRKK
jgi:hypothetical protein